MVPAISVPVTPSLKRVIAVSNKNTNIYGACVLVPVKTLWAPGRCRHQDGCWRYALPRQGDFLFFFFFCQYPIIWKWQHNLIVMDMKIPCVLGCTITKMTKYYTKRSNNGVFNFDVLLLPSSSLWKAPSCWPGSQGFSPSSAWLSSPLCSSVRTQRLSGQL